MSWNFRKFIRTCGISAAALLTGAASLWAQEPVMPPVLPPTTVEAQPPVVPPTDIEAMIDDGYVYDPVVDGDAFHSPLVDGYLGDRSTAGSIIDLPDADIPATVNVIPRDVLRDQSILSMKDLVRDAGGLAPGGDSLFADRLFLRGFELGSRDFRKDGFLDPTFVPRDFQNIERVEILKGPASVLYGAGSPAGMVNLITKKPLDGQFSDFGFTFGSFNQQRYTADTNGYLTGDGNSMYRLNIAHEDMNGFQDFNYLSRTLVAPGVTFKVDDNTRFTWLGEWHRDHRRGYQGIPAIGGNPLALPPNTYVGEPANDFIHYEEFRQTLLLTHDLNDYWSFNIGGQSLFYQFPGSVTAASGTPAGPFPPVPPPFFYRSRNDILVENEQAHSMIANLTGDFNLGGLRHQALVGMEYSYFDSDSFYSFGALPPIDASNPVYTDPATIPQGAVAFPTYRQRRVGGYLQDLITVNDNWKLLAGARFDSLDFNFRRTTFFGPPTNFNTDQIFDWISPRGGVVYQPFGDESLAVYFNYMQSFNAPGGGIYVNTTPLKPITGETFEVGVKSMIVDGLTFNVCGFHTTRKNADLNTSSFFLIQVGQERSQGVEMNLIGQVTDQLAVIGNYTYVDCVLSDPLNPVLDGNRQRNVPYNTANLWARYNLWQNSEETLGVGLGIVYSDSRPGDLNNTFDLPAYCRWDAGLFWQRGSWYANAYVENVFDTYYASSSINEYQVFPGAPINARATIGFAY